MAESTYVLVVDDDAELREILQERLANYGFVATTVKDGKAMFAELSERTPDLILLDVMLPGEDGLELCRRLRSPESPYIRVPVIFLTALGETIDRVVGLELGGDDYLPKPFQTRELIARIRAVLRRTQPVDDDSAILLAAEQQTAKEVSEWAVEETIWYFGDWRLNHFARFLIDVNGATVPLSAAEFRLLVLFLEHPQRVLSRDQIMEHIAGRSADVYDRSIDVQVSRLRNKLHDDGKNPEIIRTMRGDGYMFALPVKRQGKL